MPGQEIILRCHPAWYCQNTLFTRTAIRPPLLSECLSVAHTRRSPAFPFALGSPFVPVRSPRFHRPRLSTQRMIGITTLPHRFFSIDVNILSPFARIVNSIFRFFQKSSHGRVTDYLLDASLFRLSESRKRYSPIFSPEASVRIAPSTLR